VAARMAAMLTDGSRAKPPDLAEADLPEVDVLALVSIGTIG